MTGAGMQRAATFFVIGAVVVAAAIVYGFVVGDLFGEAPDLLKYPWFHISMIDLYAGFALVAGWIIFRERSAGRSAIWIVLLMTLGNVLAFVYALLALRQSGGDWQRFWMGNRVGDGQDGA